MVLNKSKKIIYGVIIKSYKTLKQKKILLRLLKNTNLYNNYNK